MKDSLRNLLSLSKPIIEKSWEEQTKGVMTMSVLFRGENNGVLAELVPNKEPFTKTGPAWPAGYPVLRGPRKTETKAVRWQKGDLTGSEPVVVPLDPASAAGRNSSEDDLRRILFKLKTTLAGDDSNPQSPEPGLLKEGEDLENDLKRVAVAR